MSKVKVPLDLNGFTLTMTPLKGFHHRDHRIYTVRRQLNIQTEGN